MSTYGAEYNKKFGERLQALMYERDVSQSQMARTLGISKATISSWATGKRLPRAEAMGKLCRYLNCTRADLLDMEIPYDSAPENNDNKTNMSDLSLDTIRIAKRINEDVTLRLLFSIADGSPQDDVKLAMDVLLGLRHARQGS